jgi:3-hydroxy-D-aspartate aldolase
MRLEDLQTPALVLDKALFHQNLDAMQRHVTGAGKRLRPHAKAHKCVEVARRQIAAGAYGVCCATVDELDWMVQSGIPNPLLTSPVASIPKIARIVALAQRDPSLTVAVDHIAQADLYASAAATAGIRLNVLADLDIGDHRTGAPCPEPAVALALHIDRSPHLAFTGLQAYSVSGSHAKDEAERRRISEAAFAQAVTVQQQLAALGVDASFLTGASTGTYAIDAAIEAVREIQAGSYVFMDVAYAQLGVPFANALHVHATVISANHADRVTVDAGFKALATDRPFGPGIVGHEQARWQWAGDEFGYLLFEDGPRPRLGDRIRLIPPHCDPNVNLYDRIHVADGETIVDVWRLKGAY